MNENIPNESWMYREPSKDEYHVYTDLSPTKAYCGHEVEAYDDVYRQFTLLHKVECLECTLKDLDTMQYYMEHLTQKDIERVAEIIMENHQ